MTLENLTSDEQALLDQMRVSDTAPETPAPDPSPVPAEATTDAQPEQPDRRPQMVPHAALHEERERRKEMERRLTEEAQQRRVLEERTNLLLQRIAQPQQEAPAEPLPKPEQDPFGYLTGTLQRQGSDIETVRQQLAVRQQQEQHAAAVAQIQQQAMALEAEFRSATPDYDAAVAHLRATRARELEIAGFADPMQRHNLLSQEALGIAARAMQSGRNPAEMIYEIAKHRGYQRPEAQAPQQTPTETPAERIQRAAAAQQQGRGLSQVRGTGPAPLTANALLEMSPAKFEEFLAKATPEQMAEHFGA